ncbi:MAG: methyltransferase domain-containing protein [Acidimicrobiia bacterium]
MNPSNPEKIRVLGERLQLDSGKTVLDLGCGTGGPAVLLAREYGCRVVAVDSHEPFLDVGKRRAEDAGVGHLVTFVHEDGAEYIRRARRCNVALCLGATGVLGGFIETARTLRELVDVQGHVVLGDLYVKDPVPPDANDDENAPLYSLAQLLDAFVITGLAPVTVITASEDDWNTYITLRWRSVEDWLEENPDHPDAPRFRNRSRASDLQEQRHGWAIIAGRRAVDLG